MGATSFSSDALGGADCCENAGEAPPRHASSTTRPSPKTRGRRFILFTSSWYHAHHTRFLPFRANVVPAQRRRCRRRLPVRETGRGDPGVADAGGIGVTDDTLPPRDRQQWRLCFEEGAGQEPLLDSKLTVTVPAP